MRFSPLSPANPRPKTFIFFNAKLTLILKLFLRLLDSYDHANYALLPNTVPFVIPVHPGIHPGHAAGTTAAQITETNRAYLEAKDNAEQYVQVTHKLYQGPDS